jgi:hypothetical protein
MTDPFWIDWDYDRDYASNGRSRYAHYLLDAGPAIDEIYTGNPTVEFAAIAWRYANGPIMSPGLVRRHPRVVEASVQRSDWNGQAIGSVRLIAPRPRQLDGARTPDNHWYRDLSLDSWAGRYEGVGGRELENGAYLTTEVQVLWQIPPGALPALAEIPPDVEGRHRHAVACVESVVDLLNRQIGPLIERMEA